jgi:hypothetical protein
MKGALNIDNFATQIYSSPQVYKLTPAGLKQLKQKVADFADVCERDIACQGPKVRRHNRITQTKFGDCLYRKSTIESERIPPRGINDDEENDRRVIDQ